MDTQVKERLTGAVIVVTLFVLLVPELLSGSGARSSARPVSAPPSVEGGGEPAVRTYSIDLVQGGVRQEQAQASEPGDADLAAKVVKAPDAPPTAMPPPPPTPVETRPVVQEPSRAAPPVADERSASAPVPAARLAAVEKPKAVPSPSPVETAPAPAPVTSGAAGKGWAVQLGSFASRANAQRLVKQLKGKGYGAFILEGGGTSGNLYRVRVGPAADRAAATALATKLRAAGHNGSVVSQP